MPSLTVQEFNPDSGALLGNVSTLDFGKISIGSHSRVKVISISFDDLSAVGNIKLGLIASGGITVYDAGVGHFGIQSSNDFNATTASQPLTTHFSGLNTTGTSADPANIVVPNRTGSQTLSQYIYLDIEIGSTNLAAGNGAYKIFFDFS